jgi:hypothetical protein
MDLFNINKKISSFYMDSQCYYFCSKYNNIEELSKYLLNEINSLVQNNVVFFCKHTYDNLSCDMKKSLFNDRNIVYKKQDTIHEKSTEEKQTLYLLNSDVTKYLGKSKFSI